MHAHRRDEGAKTLTTSLAGIVLLGTPHFQENNKSEWKHAPAILQLHLSSLPADLEAEHELRRLATWSQEFQTLNLLVPVLSTKERKKSKTKKKNKYNISDTVYIVVCK